MRDDAAEAANGTGGLNECGDLVRAGQAAQLRASAHQHRSRSEDATCGASMEFGLARQFTHDSKRPRIASAGVLAPSAAAAAVQPRLRRGRSLVARRSYNDGAKPTTPPPLEGGREASDESRRVMMMAGGRAFARTRTPHAGTEIMTDPAPPEVPVTPDRPRVVGLLRWSAVAGGPRGCARERT